MLRTVALAMLVLVAVSQGAIGGGPGRFALIPKDASSPAEGTIRIVNGKPADDRCRFQLSVTGLLPSHHSYYLYLYGPNNDEWFVGIDTDENGSCTVRGTATGPLWPVAAVQIRDLSESDLTRVVVMVGQPQ